QAPALPITDTLYYVGNRDVSCHLVKTSEGAVLIDTAFAQTSYLLVQSIWSVGVTPGDIVLMLHTHGHEDHCGATRRMQALTGAPAAVGEGDVETVETPTTLTCTEYHYGLPYFEAFTVDRKLRHGDAIEVGGTVFHCHATPGHTAGTMTFTFEVEEGGQTYTAGLFGGPGLWTMEDEHTEAQGYPGNREDFAASLEYLKTLEVDIWLGAHPGQCDTFGKFERLRKGETPHPFIDPSGWRQFIEGIDNRFRAMLAR
ncbi:MAG: MBL fold metallo-hydrolase, partial [bacterium]